MLWKIILSSKESCSEFFAPGNYGKRESDSFRLKNLEGEEPTPIKNCGSPKILGFFKENAKWFFGGDSYFFQPKTQTCEKKHPWRWEVQVFPNRNPWISRFHRFVFLAVTLTIRFGFFAGPWFDTFFFNSCWAKVSIKDLSSLEQQTKVSVWEMRCYCEWIIDDYKKISERAVGMENILWPTRISCIFSAGVQPFNSITKIMMRLDPHRRIHVENFVISVFS